MRRPPLTWNSGSNCVAATPVAMRASAVRFHARKVRSFANVKRASGSASLSAGSSFIVGAPRRLLRAKDCRWSCH